MIEDLGHDEPEQGDLRGQDERQGHSQCDEPGLLPRALPRNQEERQVPQALEHAQEETAAQGTEGVSRCG